MNILKLIKNIGVRLCEVPLGTEAIQILVLFSAWCLLKSLLMPGLLLILRKNQAGAFSKYWIASVPSGTSQRRTLIKLSVLYLIQYKYFKPQKSLLI
jgi:hypothetical protein